MSGRLALAHAIEDAGIEPSVATTAQLDAAKAELKADIQASNAEIARVETAVKAEIASLRGEMHSGFARQDVAIERLRSTAREMESRLLLRLGSLMVVLTGVVLAALRYWPPR